MVGGEDEDEDSEQQSGQYKDTMARSSNTGWVYDEEDEIIEALSKRVGAILNLDHRAAEAYQACSPLNVTSIKPTVPTTYDIYNLLSGRVYQLVITSKLNELCAFAHGFCGL